MSRLILKVAIFCISAILLFQITPKIYAQESLSESDVHVKEIAESCRDQIQGEMEKLLASKTLTKSKLFDTFYIPIPNTDPQKYSTQYDKIADKYFQRILDGCLSMDKKFIFVVAVDRNGYVPTHNSIYSQPLTSDAIYNAKNNRTKRIFNDRTGLAAAHNTQPFLLQSYSRDTGETMVDFSVPIFVEGKHWGALRIGYSR